MKVYEQVCPLLPERYAVQLRETDFTALEELRLGCGRPLCLRYGGFERELLPLGDRAAVEEVLQRACRRSVYAHAQTIRQGYVTVDGGHRLGICGAGITSGGELEGLREFSSVDLRIARAFPGCADRAADWLQDSALLVGPPGCGKTTLLRDLIRQLSDRRRQIVGLADERGEVSAPVEGRARLDVGSRTEILAHVPKGQAMMMLLRTMNPHWIATDEITSRQDIRAMEEISYCGVRLLATAHGTGVEDLYHRPVYQALMARKIFRQVIVLRRDKSYTMEELPV